MERAKMVPVPSNAIIPARDIDKTPVLECINLGIRFGGLAAVSTVLHPPMWGGCCFYTKIRIKTDDRNGATCRFPQKRSLVPLSAADPPAMPEGLPYGGHFRWEEIRQSP